MEPLLRPGWCQDIQSRTPAWVLELVLLPVAKYAFISNISYLLEGCFAANGEWMVLATIPLIFRQVGEKGLFHLVWADHNIWCVFTNLKNSPE